MTVPAVEQGLTIDLRQLVMTIAHAVDLVGDDGLISATMVQEGLIADRD